MTDRYEIRTGQPFEPVTHDGTLWGWSRTLDAAMRRANRLSAKVRSDVRVGVFHNGILLAANETSPSFTAQRRKLAPR